MTGLTGELLRPAFRLAPAVQADACRCDEGVAVEGEPGFLVSVDANRASSCLGTHLGLPCYR